MLFPTPHFPFLLEYCQGETGRSRRKRGLPMLREASRTLHLQRSRYGLAHTLALEPDRTLLSSRGSSSPPRHATQAAPVVVPPSRRRSTSHPPDSAYGRWRVPLGGRDEIRFPTHAG